jgi:hypothetical protein
MFEQESHAVAFIDRMRGRERSAQSVAVGKAEVDTIASVLVEMFSKNGLDISEARTDEGITLTIKYPT